MRDDDEISVASHGSSGSFSSSYSGASAGSASVASDPLSKRGSSDSLGSASIASNAVSMAASEKQVQVLLNNAELSRVRRSAVVLISDSKFGTFMLLTILANTVVLTMQTVKSTQISFGWYMTVLDAIFLAIYVVEAVVKLYAFRLGYFKSGWNLLDFFIVLSSVLLFMFQTYIHLLLNVNTQIFRLLRLIRTIRAVRSLRVLRTINFLKSLQILVTTLLKSIPALANITLLTAILVFIFMVVGCSMYGDVDPRRFGSLSKAAFRMFALITLDNWGQIWYDNKDKAPSIFVFLIIFIILANFIFINLFVAVILTNLTAVQDKMSSSRHRKLKKRRAAKTTDEQEELTTKQISPQEEDYDRLLSELAEQNIVSDFVRDGGGAIKSPKETELHVKYLMLLASLENSMYRHEKQQRILDDLVELFKQQSVEKGEMQ